MKEISKENWHYISRDGKQIVCFICPDCKCYGDLDNHTITKDGTVNPSVVCYCGYHENIKLKDFNKNNK